MEIPLQLTEFIKEHDNKTLKKGTDIFFYHYSEIRLIKQNDGSFTLEVPSQSSGDKYTVLLETDDGFIVEECNCPAFESYAECKHCLAAALYLLHKQYNITALQLKQLLKNKDTFEDEEFIQQIIATNTAKTQAKVISLLTNNSNTEWKTFIATGALYYYTLENYSGPCSTSAADLKKVSLLNFNEQNRHWKFLFQVSKIEVQNPEIKFDSNQTYSYKCTCMFNSRYRMCKHVRGGFDKLIAEKGPAYFLSFKDWTEQKNDLLAPYGITLDDEEANLFQFDVDYYNHLQVKAPAGFYKADDVEALKKLSTSLRIKDGQSEYLLRPLPVSNTIIDFEIGYVFNLKSKRLGIGFELELAKVYHKAGKLDIKKLSLNTPANLPLLKQLTDEQYQGILQLSDEKLVVFLKSKGNSYISNYGNPFNQIGGSAIKELFTHYVDCIIKLWPHITQAGNVFLLQEGNYSNKNCKPIEVSTNGVNLSFEVTNNQKFITIWLVPVFDNMPYTNHEDAVSSSFNFLFNLNGVFNILKNIEDIPVLEHFVNGFIKVPLSQKLQAIKSVITPLQERYAVRLPPGFEIETVETDMQPQVLLKEFNEQYLMIQPQFLYDAILVD
ncbi:MAG: SWIM zinc finger family protein, partial [Ferruginibacter sp.]